MKRQELESSGLLSLYDRMTGIFNEIFDSRLLTAVIAALVGYCCLFTQRKFPMRWMVFVLFGMVLLEAMYFGAPVVSSRNGGSLTLFADGGCGHPA